ncbi:hypothetical protein [Herbaspirillum sp. ST 5-3]|uniref:hypothetical protein n=1 Tax=Oxalobacteraceae TaxID=75682 RepID=UPI0010A524E0|nr:hypothetical protein [Herbaspirillum sp. ST 5-3]
MNKNTEKKATDQVEIQDELEKKVLPIFELFKNSLPNPKLNACATCRDATPMIIGDKGKIYCQRTLKWSWDETKTNVPMCIGNPTFIPENIEKIKY